MSRLLRLGNRLWSDESGFVVSAELVLLGTLGVIGATVGLHVAATAVNEELIEVAHAIRSLDQSYAFTGFVTAGAATAGSSYMQPDVDESLEKLRLIENGVAEQPDDERDRDRDVDRPRDRAPAPRPSLIPRRDRDRPLRRERDADRDSWADRREPEREETDAPISPERL